MDHAQSSIESIPGEILGIIIGKLRPVDLMMICMTSKGMLTTAHTPDLRGRRLVEEAARYGNVHTLEHALELGPMTTPAYVVAAAAGNAETLAHLLAIVPTESTDLHRRMTIHASRGGHLDVLKLLHSIGIIVVGSVFEGVYLHVAEWVLQTFPASAVKVDSGSILRSGNLDVIKLLHSHRFIYTGFDTNATYVVQSGNLELVKWWVENIPDQRRIDLIHFDAEDVGSVDILEWLHIRGYRHNGALRYKYVEVLDWYHTHGYDVGDVYGMILQPGKPGNRIKMFDWALSHGHSMTAEHIDEIWHVDGLRWAIDNGQCVVTPELIKSIVIKGAIDMLDLLHSRGHPCQDYIHHTVDSKYTDVLEWMIKNGATLTPDLYINAHYKAAVCLHRNGCPMSADIYVMIVRKRGYEYGWFRTMLSFLQKQGCAMDSRVCLESLIRDDDRIIQFVHEQGCECCSTCDYWNRNPRK